MSTKVSQASQLAQLHPWVVGFALAFAAIAAGILIWYLIKHPPLDGLTRIMLLLGLGVFPISAAAIGNIAGFEHSSHRVYCGSCHVMKPWVADSNNPKSKTLAAQHARNERFGPQNCYICHEDYGMFGTLMTKLGGMRHVWLYYTEYRYYSLKQAVPKIHLIKPFPNAACMSCHSTDINSWESIKDHQGLLSDIRSGKASCVSDGCHGPAHPFAQRAQKRAKKEAKR